MANNFFNASGVPSAGSGLNSPPVRSEFALIAAAFDKMPTLTGNANKVVVVNGTGTALTALAASGLGLLPLAGGTLSGRLGLAAGSVSSPSAYYSAGAGNTGFYFSGTAILAASNGINYFSIDTSTGVMAINPTFSAPPLTSWNSATSGDNVFVSFKTEAGGTQRGFIDYNRAGSAVRYNTTSDYRLKNLLGDVADPMAALRSMRVHLGIFKDATQERPMFVAHELQAHAPYAVSGEKDDVHEDGTPRYQGVDHSLLVPLLVAGMQALDQRLSTLESTIH